MNWDLNVSWTITTRTQSQIQDDKPRKEQNFPFQIIFLRFLGNQTENAFISTLFFQISRLTQKASFPISAWEIDELLGLPSICAIEDPTNKRRTKENSEEEENKTQQTKASWYWRDRRHWGQWRWYWWRCGGGWRRSRRSCRRWGLIWGVYRSVSEQWIWGGETALWTAP